MVACARLYSCRGIFACVGSMGSSSGAVGLLPRTRHEGAFKGEVVSVHGVVMPSEVCLIRSTASVISCLMVMVSLFFSSAWMVSTVSAHRVLSWTDVIIANANTCLP